MTRAVAVLFLAVTAALMMVGTVLALCSVPVATTIAVAALFWPARTQIQTFVDCRR